MQGSQGQLVGSTFPCRPLAGWPLGQGSPPPWLLAPILQCQASAWGIPLLLGCPRVPPLPCFSHWGT